MTARRGLLLIAALIALPGCLATRADVRRLETELAASRQSNEQLLRELREESRRQNQTTLDSLRAVSIALRGEFTGQLRQIDRQVSQVRELTGQGQQRIAELNERIAQQREAAAATPPAETTPAPADNPDELYSAARSALERGSFGTARAGFDEYLRAAPQGRFAADAQLGIAQSYAEGRDPVRALEEYARLVQSYPSSPRVPTALYRSAVLEAGRGNRARARVLFQQVVADHPRSEEAPLARRQLQTLGTGAR